MKVKSKKSVKKYDKLSEELKKSGAWTLEKYMKKCFGQERLAYRVGGTLIKKIEEKEGMSVVRDGFYKDPDDFAEDLSSNLVPICRYRKKRRDENPFREARPS